MKTFVQKPNEIKRKWYVVDATDVPLGRLASQVAAVLRGKNKPEFSPDKDCGDYVIITNCSKVALTGKKTEQKFFRYHTGYVGGLKEIKYDRMLREKSDKAVFVAVKGMLPKNSLGRTMIKKLKVFVGPNHEHQAQQPVELKIVGKR